MQGETVERVAARLGVRLCTVRTHLQRIYDKTNTHRQAELVRRLLQGPAGLRFERLPTS
jgi:DNA-binding CsgD family transcriptional regulator